MRLRIIIDNQDASADDGPLTLTVYRDDDSGNYSRIPKDFDGIGSCITGQDIPELLRQLAETIEDGDLGEAEEFDLCSKCKGWNDDGEGWDGLCGNCADRAENTNEAEED